jgi:hypothetical protein
MNGEQVYYEGLKNYLVEQLSSNFLGLGRPFTVYGCVGELRTGLRNLIRTEALEGTALQRYYERVLPLNLDVFLVVMDPVGRFEIVICEVKRRPALGLRELSQLIGYCIIANCTYGLLINVDNACSERFRDILRHEQGITHIYRTLAPQPALPVLRHHIGVMMWNSVTERMTYTRTGAVLTIPHLCVQIADSLNSAGV